MFMNQSVTEVILSYDAFWNQAYPVYWFKIIHVLLYIQHFQTTVAPLPAQTMLSNKEFLSLLSPQHQKTTREMAGELEENAHQIRTSPCTQSNEKK